MTEATTQIKLPKDVEERLKLYAKLKAAEKVAKAKASELAIDIIEDFHKNKLDSKLPTEFGTFSLCKKPKYKYSKKVETLEAEVKQLKHNEVDSGKAKVESISEYLTLK